MDPRLSNIIHRVASSTYVVLYKTKKGKLTLLIDPGLNRVCSYSNKRLAEYHAKENDGMAATWADAWALLVKEYGTLEKLEDELLQKIVESQKTQKPKSPEVTL